MPLCHQFEDPVANESLLSMCVGRVSQNTALLRLPRISGRGPPCDEDDFRLDQMGEDPQRHAQRLPQRSVTGAVRSDGKTQRR